MKRLFFLSIFLLSYSMVAMNAALVFASGSSEVQANQSQGNSPLSLSGLALKEVAYLHAQQKLADADLDCLKNKEAGILIDDLPGFSLTASRDLKRLSISLSRYLQRNGNDWRAAYLSISWPVELQGMNKWQKLCKTSLSKDDLEKLKVLVQKDSSCYKKDGYILGGTYSIPILFKAGFYEKHEVLSFLKNILEKAVIFGDQKLCAELKNILDLVVHIESIRKQSNVEFLPSAHYELLLDRGLSEKGKKTLLQKIMKKCNFDETNYLVREFYDNNVHKWLSNNTIYDSLRFSDIANLKDVIQKLQRYTDQEKVNKLILSLCKDKEFETIAKLFNEDLVDPNQFFIALLKEKDLRVIYNYYWPITKYYPLRFTEIYPDLDQYAVAKCIQLMLYDMVSAQDLEELQELKNKYDLRFSVKDLNERGYSRYLNFPINSVSLMKIAFEKKNKKLLTFLLQLGIKISSSELGKLNLSRYSDELIQLAMKFDALPKVNLHSIIKHIWNLNALLKPQITNDLLKILDLGLFSSSFCSKKALSELVVSLIGMGINFNVVEDILGRGILDLDLIYDQRYPSETLFSACEKALERSRKDINKIPTLKKHKDKKNIKRKKRYFKATMAAVGVGIFSYIGYQWLKGYFSAD